MSTRKRATRTASKPSKRARQASVKDEGNDAVDGESSEGPKFYLIKSEPESRVDPRTKQEMKFSVDDLAECPDKTSMWDGVRNYQARNVLKAMKYMDKALFYHSNCKLPGVIGIVEVVREAYPDPTQFDKSDSHYDPKSTEDNPRWVCVDVKLIRKLNRLVSLHELKKHKELENMVLLKSGRLSVQPVRPEEFVFITDVLAERAAEETP